MSWQADGILDHDDDEGDALLDAVLKEVHAKAAPYYHRWKPTDMDIWDNLGRLPDAPPRCLL